MFYFLIIYEVTLCEIVLYHLIFHVIHNFITWVSVITYAALSCEGGSMFLHEVNVVRNIPPPTVRPLIFMSILDNPSFSGISQQYLCG